MVAAMCLDSWQKGEPNDGPGWNYMYRLGDLW